MPLTAKNIISVFGSGRVPSGVRGLNTTIWRGTGLARRLLKPTRSSTVLLTGLLKNHRSVSPHPNCDMSTAQNLLRHFLAALAYRTQKALRDAPAEFSEFRAGINVRTPHELVWHMTGVIGYARTFFMGGEWRPDRLETFDAEVRRFHDLLEDLARHLDAGTPLQGTTYERLLQGPLSDAMTHAGQLAMLRRLAGSPVPPENFLRADIRPDNLSPDQPSPIAPKPGWLPDQPPPAPGRHEEMKEIAKSSDPNYKTDS